MSSQTTNRVFQQLGRCMNALVGGSGHMAGYSLSPETFQIVKVEELGGGLTKYHFTARASYESEFTVYNGDERDEEHTHIVSGSIALDSDFGLVRDESGRVMLEPWNCFDPER